MPLGYALNWKKKKIGCIRGPVVDQKYACFVNFPIRHIYTCMCKNCANASDLFKYKEKFQSTQGIGFQISAKVAALNFHFVNVIV